MTKKGRRKFSDWFSKLQKLPRWVISNAKQKVFKNIYNLGSKYREFDPYL